MEKDCELDKVGEEWRKMKNDGRGCRRMEKDGGWRRMKKDGEGWSRMEKNEEG